MRNIDSCGCGVVLCCLLLCACGGDDTEALHRYIRSVLEQPGSALVPVPALPHYQAFYYQADGLRDPFYPSDQQISKEQKQKSMRPPDVLENFPLGGLIMVGTISKGSQLYALLADPDKKIYRAKVGDYIGKDHGRIVKIEENTILVRENEADILVKIAP
jgi:type IV pilus assembly protein PilP